ncbi:Glucoamylase, intracellular sporulation-specific [Rhizophlyctis rosea]|nr:Glucoamylase, intracellular sporulation-specific [Rhizophlyctis rosea]
MSVVHTFYAHDPSDSALEKRIWDYAYFERHLQTVPNPSNNIAEPKWNVDGTAYTLPWGRPQNDGPALRALTLTNFAHTYLLKHKNASLITSILYDSNLPSSSLIKNNLEFTSHNWPEDTVDLWEEIRGTHFYTRMVQHAALVRGSQFAYEIGDPAAARWYASQTLKIATELENHWSPEKSYLLTTLDRTGGIDYKSSGLDVSILLASLHANPPSTPQTTPLYPPWSDEVLATALALDRAMQPLYAINNITHTASGEPIATAIGRYPEDKYDGYGNSEGNPWILTTLAYAEVLYRTAEEWAQRKWIPVTDVTVEVFKWVGCGEDVLRLVDTHGVSKLPIRFAHEPRVFLRILKGVRDKADAYFRRVEFHAVAWRREQEEEEEGRFPEQINKDSGKMQGAKSLTWSYAAFLTTVWARERVLDVVGGLFGEGGADGGWEGSGLGKGWRPHKLKYQWGRQ